MKKIISIIIAVTMMVNGLFSITSYADARIQTGYYWHIDYQGMRFSLVNKEGTVLKTVDVFDMSNYAW